MKRFDPLNAIQQLLDLDPIIFNETVYLPWYVEKPGIIKLGLAWLLVLIFSLTFLAISAPQSLALGGVILLLISLGLTIIYFGIIKAKHAQAKHHVIKQVMRLENKAFMQAILPLVAETEKPTVQRIAKYKDFTTQEYISITLSTQERVIRHTESFIQDIERLFASPEYIEKKATPHETYDPVYFKVPQQAKNKYEAIKNQSCFHDQLDVTVAQKEEIIDRAKNAMNHVALGKNHLL